MYILIRILVKNIICFVKKKILLNFSVYSTIVPCRLSGELLKRHYSAAAFGTDEYSNCIVVCCKLYYT